MTEYRIDLWINNESIKADRYTEVFDPGCLTKRVGYVAQGEMKHVNKAVVAAYNAFQQWQKTDYKDRAECLLKAADWLINEASFLAPITTQESGILLADIQAELRACAQEIRSAVTNAQKLYEPFEMENESTWIKLVKKPLGVVVALVPWNVPYTITMLKLSSALVTGNTIVVKPSPFSSIGLSLALQKISKFFPSGVINVLHGDADIGAGLVTHPLVRKISLTGGAKTAKSIMKLAAESLKRVHFELGGNDPAIVLEDADLETVVPKIVRGAFARSGQVCVAIKRVYVPKRIFHQFCELFCQVVDQYRIGHGLNHLSTLAPLNNKNQFQFVKSLVEKAKQSGYKVLELGTKLDPDQWENGYYMHPTVVVSPDADHEIVTEEQFGPVIPLVPYQTEEEAIMWANRTEYGLGSSIWTSDFERAIRFAHQLEAGMTSINGGLYSQLGHLHLPFGGVKQSGIGWERSVAGLLEYINYHSLTYHK